MIVLEFLKIFGILFAVFLVAYIPAVLFSKNSAWYTRSVYLFGFAFLSYIFHQFLSVQVGCYIDVDPIGKCSIMPGIISLGLSLYFVVLGLALLIVGFVTKVIRKDYVTKTKSTTTR